MPSLSSAHGPRGRGERLREVETHLRRAGLLDARGRPPHVEAPEDVEEVAGRLAQVLAELGPGFALCGRYLATRVDLLHPRACLALGAIAEHREPAPPATVAEVLVGELGGTPESAFRHFEPTPVYTHLLHQTHRATGPDGAPLTVKVVLPERVEAAVRDLEILDPLTPVVAVLAAGAGAAQAGLDGFRRSLPGRLHLEAEAEALESLAAEGHRRLHVPAVVRELSSARVLTLEEVAGASLLELTTWEGGGTPGGGTWARHQAARRLCQLWLELTLGGRRVPVEVDGEAVLFLADGRLALAGGAFTAPPAATQERFRSYLLALIGEDPGAALAALLPDMDRRPGAAEPEDLLARLRQAVPFRDGAWSPGGTSLAELAFIHWRLAGEGGYRPRRHLLELWQGWAWLAAAVRPLAGGDDPLRQEVEELRLTAGTRELWQALAPDRLAGELAPTLSALVEMPAKLDRALDQLNRGEARIKLEVTEEGTGAPKRESRRAAGLALALVLASAVLLAGQLAGPWLPEPWTDALVALAAAGLGLGLLKAISHKAQDRS